MAEPVSAGNALTKAVNVDSSPIQFAIEDSLGESGRLGCGAECHPESES